MVRLMARGGRHAAVALLTLTLGACTIGPPPRMPQPPPPVPGPGTRPPAPPPQTAPPAPDRSSGAVDSLLRRARAEAAAGRYDTAISSTERAVRIAPNDPDGYEQLARLYAARGDCARAAQFAGRAGSLSADVDQQQRLRALIGDCEP